ncbi:hypothetical protein [Nesterenkonia sphaerica]|uniref:Uncharacterized protein n=1 Tax=Nesterenkonia sphaerica TaxID=1804988 RepID=A0A5R9ABA6_9MICC|nr:hypothetical protein [Nesterenkonia sphaerica]TLP75285.1 hypothetical protein FEF27_08160 [Nesterenkonia sphaerica]
MAYYMRRLQRLNMPIEDDPQVAEEAIKLGKNYAACIIAQPGKTSSGEPGYSFELHLHPSLSEEERELVAQGTIQRIQRLKEHGPDLDAWQVGREGVLRRWLVGVDLDPWLKENP